MTDRGDAEALLGALWQRVQAGGAGDRDVLLDPGALSEADLLLRVSTGPDGTAPVEVVHAIGVLRALRFLAGVDEEERLVALRLLTEVRLASPYLVADDVFAALEAGVDDGLALLGADALGRARTDPAPETLNRAVSLLEDAVRATPDESDVLAARLSNLGLAYRMRAERLGTGELDRAVSTGAQAVSQCPPGAADLAGCLANFADSLLARFERLGRADDLEAGVCAHEAAVEATPDGHPLRSTVLGKLGAALTMRFLVAEDADDIETAVALCEQAAAAATPGDPFYAQHHTNLGMARAVRATLANARGDIDGAVAACREAVAATVPGDPSAVVRWQNLAATLHDRFELLGAHDDLDGSAAAARQALRSQAALADDPVSLAMLLSNASSVLRVRGDIEHDGDDLELAVDTARRAVELSPKGHPARANRANNYALALLSRFDDRLRTDAPSSTEDLSLAVTVLREVTQDVGRHDNRPGGLSTLGLVLLRRFEHDGRTGDLDEAIRVCTEAVVSLVQSHPALAGAALNLGSAHRTRSDAQDDAGAAAAAVKAWTSGAAATGSPVPLRLACARQWAEFAARREVWDSAAQGYDQACALLPLVAWHGLGRSDQEHALMRQAPVPGEAAAAGLAVHDPERALRHLEQGRAVLWKQHLDLRDDAASLRAVAPRLAERLEQIRRALDDVNSATASMLSRS
ncbi:hypothetical protein [Streptomyces sp. DSM 15324]|uniref:hypothetical protein n=1 Tax=Streptomyces sp. DSM 15324 TaxID=1739111 RepID=UPI00074A6BB6|nr:hypothetical protein [Streptomyces sp. DSM 15324]KUO11284.1 hypothetical protein AQJ58_14715 [Streptomyces sp. DSM 15324]